MTDNINRLSDFLKENYYGELLNASKEESPAGLVIDFNVLDRFDPIIADKLLEQPENILGDFTQAIAMLLPGNESRIKVRVKSLPESRSIRIRYLRAKHLNKLWRIDAIIKSASEVKPQIYEAVFECPDCRTRLTVAQEGSLLQKPYFCGSPYIEQGCGRRGDFGDPVEKKLFDFRFLVGVEPFELTTGERPGEITIMAKEDLTTPRMQKKTDPGGNLKIVGILKEIPKRIKGKLSTKMDMYLEANYVESSEIEFEELDITDETEKKIIEFSKDPLIYEKLKASVAPGIYGFDEIKEAIVLQLFGGVRHTLPDGSTIRGNIHILLTGDPGVGKTQMLKLVANVMPRGRYVSGSGVSGAGLTATVTKNELLGSWVLEAGALILCNKGLIAIDEFDKMNKDDQIAMHEATSVETVSIAKASIVATLPAQTAVLAGANPKLGRFDTYKPIVEQIQIPETLLSRFDLKFALKDIPDKAKDEKLAEHILLSRTTPESVTPIMDTNFLRKYIAYVKRINHLDIEPEAAETMKNFYVEMRNRYAGEETKTISLTLRQYEALIRMAEASAKIRLDTKVRQQDADRAIKLLKFSLMQLGYDTETGRIDIDRLESGITASKRKRISMIIEILDEMQKESKDVDELDLLAEAETRGIESTEEIKEILDRLKKDGVVFEPRPGFIRKV